MLDLDVSRETVEALEQYAALLRKWNPSINLVSKASIDDLWSRHIVDSAQIYALGTEGDWVDIGSGGGFPGLVVATVSREKSPQRLITLVESDVRKSAFLRTVSQELSLNTRILARRIEDISPLKARTLSARALADLRVLLGHAARHLHKNGTALFMKGASWEKEVEEARSQWSFALRVHKSKTHPDAAILEVKDIQRA